MHVLLEGIVPLHIGLFLNKVTSLKLVNLDALNGAVQAFPYQFFEISSKPSSIPASAVLDRNLTGKQSGNLLCELIIIFLLLNVLIASQMRCLLHILPLLLGNSFDGNEFYQCLLLLHDICSIIFSPLITEDQVPHLRLLIQEYLHEFKRQYGINLTPKCHFLIHFPEQIVRYNNYALIIANQLILCCFRFGPPIRLWAMRFEAKHRVFKQWARTASYRNLCWSLAMKYQQQSAYMVQASLSETVTFSSGTLYTIIYSQVLATRFVRL